MPKRPLKLTIRIPEYRTPRNAWRRMLHEAVKDVQRTTAVMYEPDDRLKDCLDALQGRVGGTKTKATRALKPSRPVVSAGPERLELPTKATPAPSLRRKR
jgi:hypothetical protein